jgi:hypothetical protein
MFPFIHRCQLLPFFCADRIHLPQYLGITCIIKILAGVFNYITLHFCFFWINLSGRPDLAEHKSPAFYPVKNFETAYLVSVVFYQYAFLFQGMKDQVKREMGVCYPELHIENFNQGGRTKKVQVLGPAQQTHTGYQADQAEIMVSVQVGYEYVIDPAAADLVFIHLCLGAFSTVYQE